MKAIIMAGGEGKRLKDVTGDTPKPMVMLAGRPVLEHILLLLKENGINAVCITLRYRPELIMDYFGDGKALDMHIEYHIENEPLGTAGGVKACSGFYGSRDFLVISGDCACDFNLKSLMEAHRRHKSDVTMALYPSEAPLRYGIVLTDPRDRVVSFIEKPQWRRVVSDLVNTGIYIISPKAMELVPDGKSFDFSRDLFPKLLEMKMELRGIPLSGYWCDIGTPRAYLGCFMDALDGKLRLNPPDDEKSHSQPRSQSKLSGSKRIISCSCRARLMRAISQSLLEAGADFSDGIVLCSGLGKVHISPSAQREAVIISAEADSPQSSEELADEYAGLVEKLKNQGFGDISRP